jgi:hypothetical protein
MAQTRASIQPTTDQINQAVNPIGAIITKPVKKFERIAPIQP